MIRAAGIHKSFQGNRVLNGISLQVNSGEIYGFIGPNGAGKTTTMNILAGLLSADAGICEIGGKPVSPGRSGPVGVCGYLPEEPRFYPFLTAEEYLMLIGRVSGMEMKAARTRAMELLERTGIAKSSRRRIAGYSRGMRQRLGLASALMHSPRALLLDEPSSALDPAGRREMAIVLNELRQEGMAILLSTHILSDLEHICDRVGILLKGCMVLEGRLDDILTEYAAPGFDLQLLHPATLELLELLRGMPCVRRVETQEAGLLVRIETLQPETEVNRIFPILQEQKIPVSGIMMRKANLDDVFGKVVSRDA
ncbi:MAG TPA: ABC transporter ATP-binding protein [Clostridiales bacterium]|nr:ABC transporter ATP-binding protein [Clostridiales bacterium]